LTAFKKVFEVSINVKVKLFATFKEMAGGQGVVDVRLHRKATIRNIIEELSKIFGQEFEDAILDPRTERIKSFNTILVNGHNIELLQKLRTKLNDGDTVTFFPPAGGG